MEKKSMKKGRLKPVIIFTLCLALLLPVLAGCGSKNKGTIGNTKVVLNEVAHSIFYVPLYVAIEEGYFDEEGIDLTLVTGYGADKTMTAVLSGEADVGFMGSESSIYTYLGNPEDIVVNFAQLTQRAGNFLVSKKPIDNFSWDMLKGSKVLGGRAGGMPEMVFEFILRKNNIDPAADLSIDQSISFGDTAAAFVSSDADFTVEFEPHASSLEANGNGYIVASLGVDSGYVPYTAFSAKKSFIEGNPELIQSFTNALQRGMDYTNSHTPDELAAVIQPQFKETDIMTLTTIITRYYEQNTWKDNLIFEKDSFELLQNILEDAGELERRVPYEELVTTGFAEKAAK
ncbi:MAG: ABC transporter substrate-binding protein [Lachnospiraceae bacterium]